MNKLVSIILMILITISSAGGELMDGGSGTIVPEVEVQYLGWNHNEDGPNIQIVVEDYFLFKYK